jgi:CelD/BcsL family acetyltransferase involved in cellulose biosynthesis
LNLSDNTNELTFGVLHELEAISLLKPQWDTLLGQSICNRAFSSATWYFTACGLIPEKNPHLITAFKGKVLVGLVPLVLGANGIASFASDLADYNDLIAVPGDIAVLSGLLTQMLDNVAIKQLNLQGIRPDSNLLCAIKAKDPEFNPSPFFPSYSFCPIIDLPATYADYLASRSWRFRKKMRNLQNKVAQSDLTLRVLEPDTFPPEQLAEAFLALHYNRFGENTCFVREVHRDFVKTAMGQLFAEGRIKVVSLYKQNRLVAMDLCPVGHDSLCSWNGGFLAEVEKWSPGVLLINASIHLAYDLGLQEFDLLRGSEGYKKSWVNGTRYLGRFKSRLVVADCSPDLSELTERFEPPPVLRE